MPACKGLLLSVSGISTCMALFHAGPTHLTTKQRKEVKTEMDALGLVPSSYILHSPISVPSAKPKELEECFCYLCEGVDLALAWGTNNLQLNAGQWAYGMPRDEAWTKSVRFLQRLCDYAAPRGIYICQEAEPYVWFMVNDVPSTLKMIADVDRQNFMVLMDIGHMALAREGPDELAKIIDLDHPRPFQRSPAIRSYQSNRRNGDHAHSRVS